MEGRVQLVYPRLWVRGKPVVKGDYITISQPEEYQPYECADLVFDFSALKSPKDVAGFVARYGLLKRTEGLEKITSFLEEAAAVRLLFGLVNAIRERNIQFLYDTWSVSGFARLFEAAPKDDDELMAQASALVAWVVNEKLEGVPHGLIPEAALEADGISGPPGAFLWVAYPESLLQYIYHQLAMTLNLKVPVASCPECGRIFRVEHGHQEYCSPRCANRARIKRFRSKRHLPTL
ncbi:CGNR zinc finger domain-containing protein [Anaerolinea sp.]|uniref:CGNR zinc finger domain-containing protein n=1 Tax=Anaerolinea sp. TaxID=1872519 RepID=UPI002ACD40D3|nr:CGNR zinc finger domain-containing protein [Anaerolinea sp.]